MSNNAKSITVESVAAQAVEEKLVVPSQAEGEKDADVVVEQTITEEKVKLEVIEGEKKPLKTRLKERLIDVPVRNMKESKNRRMVVAASLIGSAAVIGYFKYVAKKAAEAVEAQVVSDEPEVDKNDDIVEESGK